MAVWVGELNKIEYDLRRKKQLKAGSRRKLEFISLSFLFLVLFSQLCIRLAITETSYSIEHMRAGTLLTDGQLRESRLKLAEKLAPKALISQANKRLGMVEGSKINTKKIFR